MRLLTEHISIVEFRCWQWLSKSIGAMILCWVECARDGQIVVRRTKRFDKLVWRDQLLVDSYKQYIIFFLVTNMFIWNVQYVDLVCYLPSLDIHSTDQFRTEHAQKLPAIYVTLPNSAIASSVLPPSSTIKWMCAVIAGQSVR